MKKIVVLCLLPFALIGQRTQIGKDMSPPAESGMAVFPLFYVDTTANSYYERQTKVAPWIYKPHVQHDTVVVHDTIVITKDTIIKVVHNEEFLFPEDYGATNTLSVGADGISADAKAWQKCIDIAAVTGQTIYGSGKPYFINRLLLIPLAIKDGFYINGNWSDVILSSGTTFIKRQVPADNGAANVYIRTIRIENFNINGDGKNLCFDMNSTYGMSIEHLKVNNVDHVVSLKFCLQTVLSNFNVTNYRKGVTVGIGTWPGASMAASNAQSNNTQLRDLRFWGQADTAIDIQGCSGIALDNIIIEGFSVNTGINFYAPNTTVKGLSGHNLHFECTNGSKYEFIKIRSLDAIVTLDEVFGQYPSILVDAQSTSGSGHVTLSNIGYWVSLNNKAFRCSSANPVSWGILETNVAQWRNDFSSAFTGDKPVRCSNPPNCGYNKFNYFERYIPR